MANKCCQVWIDEYMDQSIKFKEVRKNLLEKMDDHYWDSLEKDRDLILKHIREVLELD